MSTKAKDTGGADFDPVPAGTHRAVCIGVIDIGTQPSGNPTFPERAKIIINWELPDEEVSLKGGEAGPKVIKRIISQDYTNSLAKKANLRADLESWRGRTFTEEELKGFELKNLLGASCLVSVIHNAKGGRTYANVQSVSAPIKGQPKPTAEAKAVHFDLDTWLAGNDVHVDELPKEVPAWIQKRIKQSSEWQQALNPGKAEPTERQKANQPEKPAVDDDVPF
jgi:hypothetical protein